MTRRAVRFYEFEVDFVTRELRQHGTKLRLEAKPFRVLELLLRRPGELVTRAELFQFLWPDSHVGFAHGLNTAVNSLRHVLGDSSRECHFIETRPGLGYRFAAPVKEVTAPGDNLDAYQDCLRGRYFLDRMAEDEVYKAIACFKSAAAHETCCSLAHAGIADAYCQLALLGSVCPSQVACHARSSAELALGKDPGLAQAYVSVGRVKLLFDWDWDSAREAVRSAFALEPNSVPAHTLHALLLSTAGSHDQALEACYQSLLTDPLSFPANVQLAASLYAARDYTNTIDQCWKMLTLAPRFPPAQLLLALSYQQLGLTEESVVEFQNAKTGAGYSDAATGGLGQLFAAAGLKHQAGQAYRELSLAAQNRYVSSYSYALICAGRGQKKQALSFLEASFEVRDPACLLLNADARFDSIRHDVRFPAILCRASST